MFTIILQRFINMYKNSSKEKELCCICYAVTSTADLKEILAGGRAIEQLRLKQLTQEMVSHLIESQVSIRTLILDESVVSGPLLAKLLSALNVDSVQVKGSLSEAKECCEKKKKSKDDFSHECKHSEDKEDKEDKDSEKKKDKEEESEEILKFKGLDFSEEPEQAELKMQLKEEQVEAVKFKSCMIPESIVLWMVKELNNGELKHLNKISFSKDPASYALLSEYELPEGLTLELKKKDSLSIVKESLAD